MPASSYEQLCNFKLMPCPEGKHCQLLLRYAGNLRGRQLPFIASFQSTIHNIFNLLLSVSQFFFVRFISDHSAKAMYVDHHLRLSTAVQ